jgi:prepilin-type processing-associated H-X9-DG protein
MLIQTDNQPMNSKETQHRAVSSQANVRAFRGAFTLLELVVVLATLVILLTLLGTGMARMKPNGYAVQCLNNTRQLASAWLVYADDNAGKLVINLHGGAASGGVGDPTYGQGWAAGWLDWTSSPDNTNTTFLTSPRYARLAPYLNRSTNVFKCPADKYLSSVQQSLGWSQRARSYSLNLALGAGNAQSGPWDSLYNQLKTTSDFLIPSPAETWAFLDEHPDSMNDPGFFNPRQTLWLDNPGTLHNGGGAFAFADGHSEIHKWTGSLTRLTTVSFNFSPIYPPVGDADIHWMSYHAPRLTTASY